LHTFSFVFHVYTQRIVTAGMFKTISLFLVVMLLATINSAAQDEDDDEITFPLENFYVKRKKNVPSIFTKFTLGLSLGYGKTFFDHKLDNFTVGRDSASNAPFIFTGAGARYSNWVNRLDSLPSGPTSFLVKGDTAQLGFKGRGLNIPFKATLHYTFDRYRIGFGYSLEYMKVGEFTPTNFKEELGRFTPPDASGMMRRLFIVLGASFYRWDNNLLVADVNVGNFTLGSGFDNTLITKGAYFNIGVSAEHDFSEYLKGFVRPSLDFKSYTLNVAESPGDIRHKFNAFYLNVGLSYRLPELPKCFHPDCHIQINHAHGDREYRSRRHNMFKKQNPHYGENYPRLIKEKRKNRRKLNPY